MLIKQLQYLADTQGAETALGARVPIILTSRANTILALRCLRSGADRRAPGRSTITMTHGWGEP